MFVTEFAVPEAATPPTVQGLPDWRALCDLTDDELGNLDIAAVNLACAAGLPGSEVIDAAGCLNAVDDWAEGVRRLTERGIEEEFRRNPERYDHSEPLYRMVKLVLTLQTHCGVRYDPSKVGAGPDDPFDLHEHFVYGPIQGPGGTCATLPTLFAAVGRRLGYPIRLVTSKQHMFCRWDDPDTGVRVNIDGACAEGVNSYPDERYRKYPFPMTRAEERLAGHLDSMTPREELSVFVWRRGSYWHDLGNFRRAVAAYLLAGKVESSRVRWLVGLRTAELDWERRLLALRPTGFPRLDVLLSPARRRWPGLDWDLEKRLRFLEAAENVLKDPELDERCWEPLRTGRPTKVALPGKIVVDCTGEELCTTHP